MSDFQDWCKGILPIVKAAADGDDIEVKYGFSGWVDVGVRGIRGDAYYRIKKRTIKIGDFDVPEPMRVEPESDVFVYCATPHLDCAVTGFHWTGNDSEKLLLRRGMVHASTESAKIHAGAIISLTAAK